MIILPSTDTLDGMTRRWGDITKFRDMNSSISERSDNHDISLYRNLRLFLSWFGQKTKGELKTALFLQLTHYVIRWVSFAHKLRTEEKKLKEDDLCWEEDQDQW